MPSKPKEPASPKLTYRLAFDNTAQQARWARLMQLLRERYPEAGTQAERVSIYLDELGIPL